VSINPIAMSPAEFAKAIGCSRAFVYQQIAAKKIVARKLGRRTLVFLADNEQIHTQLPRFEEVEKIPTPRGRGRTRRQP